MEKRLKTVKDEAETAQRKAVERATKLRAAKEEREKRLKAVRCKIVEKEACLSSVMGEVKSKEQELFLNVQKTRCEIENMKLK